MNRVCGIQRYKISAQKPTRSYLLMRPSKREIAKAILSRTASQRTKYLGISLTEEVKDAEKAIEPHRSLLCCDKILRL